MTECDRWWRRAGDVWARFTGFRFLLEDTLELGQSRVNGYGMYTKVRTHYGTEGVELFQFGALLVWAEFPGDQQLFSRGRGATSSLFLRPEGPQATPRWQTAHRCGAGSKGPLGHTRPSSQSWFGLLFYYWYSLPTGNRSLGGNLQKWRDRGGPPCPNALLQRADRPRPWVHHLLASTWAPWRLLVFVFEALPLAANRTSNNN